MSSPYLVLVWRARLLFVKGAVGFVNLASACLGLGLAWFLHWVSPHPPLSPFTVVRLVCFGVWDVDLTFVLALDTFEKVEV